MTGEEHIGRGILRRLSAQHGQHLESKEGLVWSLHYQSREGTGSSSDQLQKKQS